MHLTTQEALAAGAYRRKGPPLRVNVLKPGLTRRTDGARKKDWTCVYISSDDLPELLELALGDRKFLSEAVRRSAVGAMPRADESFSEAVLRRTRILLKRVIREQAALAAENNAAWESAL